MLKIFGSDMCPDCRECKINYDMNNIEYEYVDINKSLRDLKDFLKLRDSLPVFDHTKEINNIGIPAIVDEDGTVILDWKSYLTKHDLPVLYKEGNQKTVCSIDGEGC